MVDTRVFIRNALVAMEDSYFSDGELPAHMTPLLSAQRMVQDVEENGSSFYDKVTPQQLKIFLDKFSKETTWDDLSIMADDAERIMTAAEDRGEKMVGFKNSEPEEGRER